MQILLPVVSSWVSIQGHRSLVQVIPEPFRKFWDRWELRALVLLSLVSQLILLFVASRRKYSKDNFTKVLVWSAYMIADWVPTFAMGVISVNVGDFYDKNGRQKNDMNPQLIAFWAPFFLIHLGGPYSITAYALEDSELWLRHLVSLVSKSLLTAYIIILSWEKTTSRLTYLCVPMLIIGIIKYMERIQCLYSCRIGHLRDSLYVAVCYPRIGLTRPLKKMLQHMGLLLRLFTGVIFIPEEIGFKQKDFRDNIYPSKAFGIIRRELESMYNVLYTKKYYIVQSWRSIVRQIGTFGASITVLVLYIVYFGSRSYSSMDHAITLVLLIHVVLSDFIAQFIIVDFILSLKYDIYEEYNRMTYFLEIVNGEHPFWRRESLEKCNFLSLIWKGKENCLGNYLLSFDLLHRIVKDSNVNVTRCSVSRFLEEMIFGYFKNKTGMDGGGYKYIIQSKLGIQVSPSCLEFYKTVIAWHLATNLFFYSPHNYDDHHRDYLSYLLRETKNLSDYMLFLLMKRSYMLPHGTGLIIIHHTLSEARELFPQKPKNSSEAEAANMLLGELEMLAQKQSTPQNESVLVEACKIAKQLIDRDDQRGETWELLADFWMEIVGYAAAHSKVENHPQQLRKGGEFLTKVWLLQAYFGLLDEIRQDDESSEIPSISRSL